MIEVRRTRKNNFVKREKEQKEVKISFAIGIDFFYSFFFLQTIHFVELLKNYILFVCEFSGMSRSTPLVDLVFSTKKRNPWQNVHNTLQYAPKNTLMFYFCHFIGDSQTHNFFEWNGYDCVSTIEYQETAFEPEVTFKAYLMAFR